MKSGIYFLRTILTLVVALGASGCASTGWLSSTGFALVSLYREGEMVSGATGGNKMGASCTTNWVGVLAIGDSSIDLAKRNGGITTVTSVDREITNFVGLYGKSCTIVRGN